MENRRKKDEENSRVNKIKEKVRKEERSGLETEATELRGKTTEIRRKRKAGKEVRVRACVCACARMVTLNIHGKYGNGAIAYVCLR